MVLEPAHTDFEVGDLIPGPELYPDADFPADMMCEIETEGPTCWTESPAPEIALVPAVEVTPDEDLPENLICEVQEGEAPSCWVEPEPLVAPTEPEEPTNTVSPQPEPESEPEAVTTEPETGTQPATEPEPEPAPESETEQPLYQVGDVVPAQELYPDEDLPENLVCEIMADGHPSCWAEPEETEDTETVAAYSEADWVPPTAGMIPTPAPACSDDRSTWDETCTPPSQWSEGEFSIGERTYETPRLTTRVLDFYLVCQSTPDAPCYWLIGLMSWPLDYLGARPSCVHGEYLDRLAAGASTALYVGEVQDRHGWHNCATVIDPLVGDPPTAGDDVGRRLSDTGLSLAERCRAVLPEDVTLETSYGGIRSDGTRRDPIRFTPGHAGCDEWADWVEYGNSPLPDCFRSSQLAEEWMEHHYSVHEGYIGGGTC